jgi:Fe(II)/alpha-ketoglutarate-dependent arginine beta-hydroxylase
MVIADEHDAHSVAGLCAAMTTRYPSSEDEALLRELPVLCHDLPARLKNAVNEFRFSDDAGFLVVRGHHVDQDRIGPTPDEWRNRPSPDPSLTEELTLLLYAGLLGDPFGWQTQQDGQVVHEVFPIRRDETAQLGTSSRILLTWHTEDAFHDFRADYLILFALRNPDRVPTTVGHLDPTLLDGNLLDVLFSERFVIKPDYSHLMENNSAAASTASAFDAIAQMQTAPRRVALLYGDRRAPYLRLDPDFMDAAAGDVAARRALDAIIDAVNVNLRDVVLEPGDLLILDNLKVVHGRRPFTARYDGTDRWLKRVNVTRDLRKSRAQRATPTCRLVG